MKEKLSKERLAQIDAQKKYSGASTDNADNNKADQKDVEQSTRMMNNNPRNSDY